MGVLSTIMGACGFGIGVPAGLVIGYYFFIYYQPTHVENPKVRPLVERDTKSLEQMLPEIPMWVKNPDHDRVDWLNRFIELMWPYLDKAICKTVKTIAEPIIKEKIPKYKIDAVEFDSLTLGNLPPTFQGGGLASICFASYHLKTISSKLSLLLSNSHVSHREASRRLWT